LQRLKQQIMQASAQNGITEQFRIYVHQELSHNRIPPDRTSALLQQLNYLKYLTDIRQGTTVALVKRAIVPGVFPGAKKTSCIWRADVTLY